MPISFACGCGKQLRAKDELAGKKTKCPECGSILTIPAPPQTTVDEDDVASFLAQPAQKAPQDVTPPPDEYAVAGPGDAPTPPDRYARAASKPVSAFAPAPRKTENERPRKSARVFPETESSGVSIGEYGYWLLLFALIPLVFSLLSSEQESLEDRIAATVEAATPEQAARIEAVLENENATMRELLNATPEGKLAGAHLSHFSYVHWAYAGVATTGFLLLILLMFSVERSQPLHLLGIGLFTGTVGIVFLFAVQLCSHINIGRIRGRGVITVILIILALIGLSYRSAHDPNSNFLLSALGYTFGVGLCEELTKALPLLLYFRRFATMGWRGACLWGLASGIGFGVSEGIMYSGDMYNGLSGPGIYVVRFVSCVALHAMWAGAVGITIARTQRVYEQAEDWAGLGLYILRVLAVPMVLHGFYDTLLKKDMNVWALVVALVSFAWFAFQIERARGDFPEAGLGHMRKRQAG